MNGTHFTRGNLWPCRHKRIIINPLISISLGNGADRNKWDVDRTMSFGRKCVAYSILDDSRAALILEFVLKRVSP